MKKYLFNALILIAFSAAAQQNPFLRYLPGERMISFECTRDGGYITITASNNYAITKLDSTGQIQWAYINNQFDGVDSINNLAQVKQTLDGGYIGVGSIEVNNDYDMIAVKLDSLGNVIWKCRYDRVYLEGFSDLIVEKDSSFTALGTDTSGSFTVRISKLGILTATKWISSNSNFLLS